MRKAVWVVLFGLAGCGGTSIAPDSGSHDSGTPEDAGLDAGLDGGSDDGGTDAGIDAGIDAGFDAGFDAGVQPISTPDDTWTWVDFPDSRCASGTPTGIGVNPHSGSTELMIFFEGGGSCTDGDSCWGPMPGARNLDGYDATTFAAAPQRNYPILSRARPQNPFKAMNLVYVPYCTGDLHGGTVEKTLTLSDGGTRDTWFYGANDVDLFLERLLPTFTGTTRVWMTGTSAGGFGSYLEYDKVRRAFGVRTDILDDSGPPLVFKGATGNAGLFSVWGYQAPAGCSPCTGFRDVLDDALTHAGRYGFLSFTHDTTIAPDFGYTVAEYPALMSTLSASLPAAPQAATFLVTDEMAHVVASDPLLAPDYLPWVAQMVSDDPNWADVCITRDGGTSACP